MLEKVLNKNNKHEFLLWPTSVIFKSTQSANFFALFLRYRMLASNFIERCVWCSICWRIFLMTRKRSISEELLNITFCPVEGSPPTRPLLIDREWWNFPQINFSNNWTILVLCWYGKNNRRKLLWQLAQRFSMIYDKFYETISFVSSQKSSTRTNSFITTITHVMQRNGGGKRVQPNTH